MFHAVDHPVTNITHRTGKRRMAPVTTAQAKPCWRNPRWNLPQTALGLGDMPSMWPEQTVRLAGRGGHEASPKPGHNPDENWFIGRTVIVLTTIPFPTPPPPPDGWRLQKVQCYLAATWRCPSVISFLSRQESGAPNALAPM